MEPVLPRLLRPVDLRHSMAPFVEGQTLSLAVGGASNGRRRCDNDNDDEGRDHCRRDERNRAAIRHSALI